MKKTLIFAFSLTLFWGLASCQTRSTPAIVDIAVVEEYPVLEIPLQGPVSEARAEISGMAWCGENLILLPQFPSSYGEADKGQVFSIPKEKISAYLSGKSTDPIIPDRVPFDLSGLPSKVTGFEGFEAITFYSDGFFTSIETRQEHHMMGYLLKGSHPGDCSGFEIDSSTLVPLIPQADLSNMSDETLVIYNNRIHTIYEANGAVINPHPVMHVFDLELNAEGDLPMATIEYRVTDATEVDAEGEFWVINYFFPGDTKLLPSTDKISLNYGLGASHVDADQVERLVALKLCDEGIVVVDRKPLYLTLTGDTARNWEGIVRFGDGFIIVTDEYPTTILGYISGPNED